MLTGVLAHRTSVALHIKMGLAQSAAGNLDQAVTHLQAALAYVVVCEGERQREHWRARVCVSTGAGAGMDDRAEWAATRLSSMNPGSEEAKTALDTVLKLIRGTDTDAENGTNGDDDDDDTGLGDGEGEEVRGPCAAQSWRVVVNLTHGAGWGRW